MSKRLIINCDDFGLTSGVNYGIVDAYVNKSISSISLMVNTPATKQAVEIMKKYAMKCVGIHVNLTIGKPVSPCEEVVSLLDEEGNFHNSCWYNTTNQVKEKELIKEFDNQITLFEKLCGQLPTHINFHHRYDFYKKYPNLANHLIKKYKLPMRLESPIDNYPYENVSKEDLFMNLDTQDISIFLKDDLVELPCHIGFVDKELMEISSLNMQRCEDSYLANAKEFKQMYTNLGYTLVGWDKVKLKEQQ